MHRKRAKNGAFKHAHIEINCIVFAGLYLHGAIRLYSMKKKRNFTFYIYMRKVKNFGFNPQKYPQNDGALLQMII